LFFNTVYILDSFGVNRARSTVHNWVPKADLAPRGGRDSAKIALDERGDQFWLVAVVELYTNVFLHVRFYPSRNTALTKMFLRELQDKHPIDDAYSSSMAHLGCMTACSNSACTSATTHMATATPSNVSFKK
jgi:transposase-like protein